MKLALAALIKTPAPVLPEMMLRAGAPPTMLSDAPVSISTPSALPIAASPAESVPIKLPATRLPEVPAPLMSTPSPELPEMTFPAPVPGVVVSPPTVFPDCAGNDLDARAGVRDGGGARDVRPDVVAFDEISRRARVGDVDRVGSFPRRCSGPPRSCLPRRCQSSRQEWTLRSPAVSPGRRARPVAPLISVPMKLPSIRLFEES